MNFKVLFLTINAFGCALGFDGIENKVKHASYNNEKLSKAKVRRSNWRKLWNHISNGEPCNGDDNEWFSGFCYEETNTCESADITCSEEGVKSRECGSMSGSSICCEGLVCHAHQSWRCVEEENKFCAGHNTLAQDCGSKWNKAAPNCCDGLVCDGSFCVDNGHELMNN